MGEITRQGETLGDAFVGVRRQLAADPLGRLINGGRLAFFWIGAHRSSVVRFAAMDSKKNTIGLGYFMLACAVLFIFANRHSYYTTAEMVLRTNKLTGTTELLSGTAGGWTKYKK